MLTDIKALGYEAPSNRNLQNDKSIEKLSEIRFIVILKIKYSCCNLGGYIYYIIFFYCQYKAVNYSFLGRAVFLMRSCPSSFVDI